MRKSLLHIGGGAAVLLALAIFLRARHPERLEQPSRTPGVQTPAQEASSTTSTTLPNKMANADAAPGSRDPAGSRDAARHLRDFMARHRQAFIHLRDTADTNIGDNLTLRMQCGTVQGRLLAICHPRECQEFVEGVLVDPQSTSEDLLYAARLLGTLAAQGSKLAESRLVELTRASDPLVVSRAIDELFEIDKAGQYKALYWTRISEGNRLIYESGPYWVDGQTKQVLQSIKQAYDAKKSRDDRNNEALARMAILESPSRAVTLDHILNGIPDEGDYSQKIRDRLTWALRVVRENPSDQSMDILRRRLERDEVAAAGIMIERVMEPPGPTSPGFVHATRDQYYDDILLAYQAMGGKLNSNQSKRLTFFGYLGDPKKRLKELLPD